MNETQFLNDLKTLINGNTDVKLYYYILKNFDELKDIDMRGLTLELSYILNEVIGSNLANEIESGAISVYCKEKEKERGNTKWKTKNT